LTQNDELNLQNKNKYFTSNYQFNIMLIYILSLEMIIKLTYNILNKNLNENYLNKDSLSMLRNILFTTISNYADINLKYKEIYLELNLNNIKLDDSSDLLTSTSLDENSSFSITLLFSGIKINYNPNLTNIINDNNLTKKKTTPRNSNEMISNNNNNIRKFCTSTFSLRSQIINKNKFNNKKRELSSTTTSSLKKDNILFKSMQNNSNPLLKEKTK
jgi:hypothetical protein